MVWFSCSVVYSEGKNVTEWKFGQVHNGKPVNLGLPLLLSSIFFASERVFGLIDWLTQFQEVLLLHRDIGLCWLEIRFGTVGLFLDISYIPPVLWTNKPSQSLAELVELFWNVSEQYRAAGTESKHVWLAWVLILHLLGWHSTCELLRSQWATCHCFVWLTFLFSVNWPYLQLQSTTSATDLDGVG